MNDASPPRTTDGRPAVIVEEHGPSIVVIRLNRPAARNPLSLDTLAQLQAHMFACASRPDLTAIILTGTEDVFASGANLRELQQLTPLTAKEFARTGQRLMKSIAAAAPLTIAAINGYCMGGGLDLALACDVRCAAPNAVFAHPGAQLGIITGWGGTQRLPRLIGQARALDMFMTARRVPAAEALQFGLIHHVADPVLDFALVLAKQHLSA